jgi:prepilin-type N-terminal cleavage/methylation domain-containing protein
MRDQTRGTARASRRRGFTLLEVAASAAMLAALLAVVGKAIVAVEISARRAEEHAEALRVVDNLLEQFLAAPWDAIDADGMGRLALPGFVKDRWPLALVSGVVKQADEPVPAKRVSLTLETGGPRSRKVTMTTWIYRAPGN